MSKSELKTKFTNLSRRTWGEEECRIMVNAALLKLVDDAGGVITLSMSDVFRVAQNGKGTLAMAMSDDDEILTLTRIHAD
jgi:hypothetical protein